MSVPGTLQPLVHNDNSFGGLFPEDLPKVSTAGERDVVIQCSNISKHFQMGDTLYHVFQGLNLEIKRGTIFSLLGHSGSGKTTLLKCILGRLEVDDGQLKMFGGQPKPGHLVGYMPQMISLLDDLTVRETLWLFGRLGRMDAKKTRSRTEFMLDILGMSSHIDMYFKTLSGGQQRRVAFAAALLNEAPLLILDEPTVGVDPILRQNIWTYLRNVVSRTNATVIITTHYIEEARHSEMVGMLLNGRLLAVSSPDTLMRTYSCDNLEDVFLKLSLEDAQTSGYKSEMGLTKTRVRKNIARRFCDFLGQARRKLHRPVKKSFEFVRVMELTKTNFLCHLRHPWAFISAVFLPAFIFFILPYAISGRMRDLNLAVVNEDHGKMGQQFIEAIDRTAINLLPYGKYEDGVSALRNGSVVAVLWFQQNFTSALKQRFTFPLAATDEVIASSSIYAALDYFNHPYAGTMYMELSQAFLRFSEVATSDFSLNKNLAKPPIELLPGVADSPNLTMYQRFISPAFMLIMIFFVISGNLCIMNVSQIERGYYDRLYTVGVSSLEIILSQTVYQMLIVFPQLFFTYLVLFYVNGMDCYGSYILISLLAINNFVSGVFLGLLVSGLSSSLHMAIIMFVVMATLSILAQGVMMPLESMVPMFRMFASLGPFAAPAVAVRNIVNKGWTFFHPLVLRGFNVSVAWTILFFFSSWLTFWIKE